MFRRRKEGKYGEFITNIFNAFLELMRQFRAVDVLDIVVVAFLIYSLIKLVRETRAEQLVKGLLIMIIAWALSSQLNLKMIKTLLDNFFQFGIIALLVVFQPELRRALEHIGRTKIGTRTFSVAKEGESLFAAGAEMHQRGRRGGGLLPKKSKTGALIVFERQTKLGEIVDTGTIVNADPSAQIIGNIFFNKAPLHDGAMIIRNGMIYAAGCILPLTKNDSLSVDLGTRHRAAVGMSENSDAVILVVSEETGTISLAINGVITRNYTRETLKGALENEILPDVAEDGDRRPIFSSFRRVKKMKKKINLV